MPGTNVIKMPGVSQLPATKTYNEVRSTMDTVLITREGVEAWKLPPFQRPLRVNARVLEVVEEIKASGGIINGVITIGVLNRTEKYLLDGQHRIHAFKLSGLPEGIVNIRMCQFDNMAEMGEEFVRLNSRLVVMRPDDILRGLEESVPALRHIRAKCPFIGYDNIRRGPKSPIVSMSLALRCWIGSAQDVPFTSSVSARASLERIDADEVNRMIHFFTVVFEAWGKDPEYARCWASLNLAVTAWTWRRCVIGRSSPNVTQLTPDHFKTGMMALTANGQYLEWLVGRQLSDRDRSPCYNRMKAIVSTRLKEVLQHRVTLPSPPWAAK